MQKWEMALDKFLSDYKSKEYVIGFILVGSYATGNNNENSDIDVHIVTKDISYKERGNLVIDNYMIEYFINPLSELYKYMEDDYKNRRRLSTTSMCANGIILFDKTGELLTLKKEALKYYNKDFEEPDKTTIMINNYSCWDLMDELKSKIKSKENINMNYYMLLQELIKNYYYRNKIAIIPFTKIEKIYRSTDYRKKYGIKNMPSNTFVNLVIKCFDKISIEYITELYNFVIEDFKITDFKLRTNM